MSTGLACAAGAALAYGAATVLQALGTRGPSRRAAGLLEPATVAGVGLDGAGVVLSVLALRSLPLFAVQAVVSGNLAVSVVLARLVLGERLRRGRVVAVLVVTAGLALVGATAVPQGALAPPAWLTPALAVSCALLAVALGVLLRRQVRAGTAWGLAAGCGFAVYAVSVRVLPSDSVTHLPGSLATWTAAAGGGLAFAALLRGLEQADVAAVSAPLVVVETLLPSAVGVVLLGDRPTGAGAPIAVCGFALAVLGALALARTGNTAVAPVPPP